MKHTLLIKQWVLSFVLLICVTGHVCAARVDSLQVHSAKMNRAIPVVAVIPDGASAETPYPTLYLLHGFKGCEKDWITKCPNLPALAEQYGMIIICPDGENSWYWDSPMNKGSQFETFVSEELVSYVDSLYPTRANRYGRAITGLSMGGHGALYLGFRHPEVYGCATAMSGGVDIRQFPNRWHMIAQLGTKDEYPERWEAHSVMNQLDSLVDKRTAILVDCGVDDFFYGVNRKLHAALLARKISHDYMSRPGGHTWEYWCNALEYHLLFERNFFNGAHPTHIKELPID